MTGARTAHRVRRLFNVTQSHIAKRFPMMRIEQDMSEHDELWKPDDRETDEHMQLRMRRAMDRVLDGEYSTCKWANGT